ncbi:uncharacterized protein LOC120707604 [Panicum virgatum]|uniref:RING-type E3 ubiquitin transferase n=1 Tax=Panicum virgatum TaxID=38727 RepID=A0A8T0SRE6_PANVG|nr:uncharacterized protein LOC120707604 [Panicum virgatum]KAG2599784.1 hypothetical protein PVAP13_5KG430900 [Panicum virgatum]
MASHNLAVCRLCFLFLLVSTTTLSSAASDPSSLCTIRPSHAPERIPAGDEEALPLLRSLELSAAYFFGGEDIHFTKDESNATSYSYVARAFSLLPLHVDRTTDPALFHVAATLTLSGGRDLEYIDLGGGRRRYVGSHTVTFYLHGYYSADSAELCMAGSGSYREDDGSNARLLGVALHLLVPNPASILDPFVTGRLRGAGFKTISLVAYAEGDYTYGGGGQSSASCPPRQPSAAAPRRGGDDFSCAHLQGQLVGPYKLQHGGASTSSSGTGAPPPLLDPRLRAPSMHVGQVQCAADGAVRAYAAFSNGTDTERRSRRRRLQPRGRRPPFVVGDEVVVAEGRWDAARRMLCLRACRVVRSESEMSVAVDKGCGLGMSFWFPGVWTIRDRSAVAGALWNSTLAAAGGTNDGGSGVIPVSSAGVHIHRSNFSDLKYSYNDTLVEAARKRYLTSELSTSKMAISGSFMPPNYTRHDFEFRFYDTKDSGHGDAYPVAIGSTIVYGDQLVADDSFSRDAVVDLEKHELLRVSYEISIHQVIRLKNRTRHDRNASPISIEERKLTAEGVFDPKTGILCMIACQERNGSTDCEILITVHLASLDATARAHGRGAISSLRNKTADPLFFEKIEIVLYGMYRGQVAESVSRMDLESIMLVISTTLPCVFAVLQIFHVRRRPEAAAGTSITMLVVLALGHVAPLVVGSEALFLSRRRHYAPFPFDSYLPYELSQAMMRAPTLIALLLQLRLIQLAWSARRKTPDDAGRGAAAAERRALWLCVPVYLAGGALTVVAHAMSARCEDCSLTVRLDPEPATLWEDLVSSAGLALDAFLLPQVAMNALAGPAAGAGRVRALSPWFYAGGTVVRALPHVYDVVRARGYVPSLRPSYVYASPRYDRYGVGWDVAVPCAAALLAVLLYLQQRVRRPAAAPPLFPSRRRQGEYELVSNL